MIRSERFELDSKRRALLNALLEEEGLRASSKPRIPRRKHPALAQLSPAQQRLWFLYQLEPENPFYNIFTGVRLTGILDIDILRHVLESVVQRHEALRTTFSTNDGVPLQQIALSLSLPLPIIDLSQAPASEREREAIRLATAEAGRPFDLVRGPLVRTTLLKLEEQEHILLLTTHHIISDGWSIGVIHREIGALYDAFLKSEPCPLPELAFHYPDFAEWQQEWLQGEVLESQRTYWRKQLDGAPSLLELPTDFRRPEVQTFRGASHSILICKALTGRLQDLSRHEGSTLFMTLLAAFQICLSHHSGQEDVVVGAPHFGRDMVETERLVGYFVNMLPLRISLRGDPSFRELLSQVRETVLGAFAHPDLPFEELKEDLRIQGSLSHNPLFQVMFALQNVPLETLQLPNLRLQPFKLDLASAKMDLSLSVREHTDGLKAVLAYNIDLFDPATASCMLDHFHNLLKAIVENPDQRISRLHGLGDTDLRRLLIEWNDTQTKFSPFHCVHHLFEAQVERTPDSVAVTFEGAHLTYRELNSRANRVAHYLRGLGTELETRVGLAFERSTELIVALLGVLKAGGAYMPLDPKYPLERLKFMIEQARPKVLLTQAAVIKSWFEQGEMSIEVGHANPLANSLTFSPTVVCLDSDWVAISHACDQNPTNSAEPLNCAYIIFTSGSSGEPKGIEVTQAGLMNFVAAAIRIYGIGPSDRVLQFASISFDTAAEEIFPSLAQGATLVLRSESMIDSAPIFVERCRNWKVTVLDLPTAYFQTLNSEMKVLKLRLPDTVRLVIIGGESAYWQGLSDWADCTSGDVRLFNTYGPTEATVVATAHECSSGDRPSARGEIPIGRPISNSQIYLLDSHLQSVPIGAIGELYIGGAGLARGYLNRPELTAEKFVPNPFSSNPGTRLYKTGDLARYRPDGVLEFMGRSDRQVKLRGFRIELDEIEATLNGHPAVQQAVVKLHDGAACDKQLAAYIVAQPGVPTQEHELLTFLSSKLPKYMLPSTITRLETVPLTASGKLDRLALPNPDLHTSTRGVCDSAPRSPVEQLLSEIWKQLLETNSVRNHDNFFSLGGHSLVATRLASRIRNTFGVEIPLRLVFDKPTLEQMASVITELQLHHSDQGWKPSGKSFVAIQPNGSKPPFFFVHGFEGYANLAAYVGPDQPMYGLDQALDANRFLTRVEQLAAHYVGDIKAICPHGPYFLGGHSFGGLVAFEMAQQLRKAGEEVGLLVLVDPTTLRLAHQQLSSAANQPNPQRQPSTERFGSRILRYLRRLQELPMRTRARYLWQRFLVMLTGITLTPLTKKGKRLTSKICLKLGWTMPPALRAFFIREVLYSDVYRAAARAYQPHRYCGPTILILAEQKGEVDRRAVWTALIPNGLTSYTVPGNHDELILGPQVGVLAGHLRNCLNQAQQTILVNKPARPASSHGNATEFETVHAFERS